MSTPHRFRTFFAEHKITALSIIIAIFLITIIIVVIFTTINNNDGVTGTDSTSYDNSLKDDQKALANFPIANYLPITASDSTYTISYQLDKTETGNYHFQLVLNAFAASARDAMIARLLSENFNSDDPLKYNITLENYYNPFTNYSLNDLATDTLPPNFTKGDTYKFGNDSTYTVQIFHHNLYNGSINTYRAIYENNQPKTMPQLIFTYQELPFLTESEVKSLNTLQ